MDLEQTVAQHDKQIGRILTILEKVADQQHRLDDALVDMAEAQEGAAQALKELANSQKMTRESTEALREELRASGAETDRRIQALVSAIGEAFRRQN